jgi:TetR/AcrR family tetracycline transcriptional repressor
LLIGDKVLIIDKVKRRTAPMAIERVKIVDAALRLLDEVGIDNLTTRKLADRLGVQQPALYWHFASKRALLDAMNEEIFRRHPTYAPPRPGDDWERFLVRYGRSFREALLAHRDGARVYSGTTPSEQQAGLMDMKLRALTAWGFPALVAMHAVLAINSFVLGSVLDEQADLENQIGWDRDAAPALEADHEVLRKGLAAVRVGGRQTAFDAGLRMIVEGIKPLLGNARPRRSRSGGSRPAG